MARFKGCWFVEPPTPPLPYFLTQSIQFIVVGLGLVAVPHSMWVIGKVFLSGELGHKVLGGVWYLAPSSLVVC